MTASSVRVDSMNQPLRNSVALAWNPMRRMRKVRISKPAEEAENEHDVTDGPQAPGTGVLDLLGVDAVACDRRAGNIRQEVQEPDLAGSGRKGREQAASAMLCRRRQGLPSRMG